MTLFLKRKKLNALKIKQTLPVNLKEGDLKLFQNDLIKDFDSVNIFEIENVNVSPDGIIFKGFSVYKQFLVWPSHAKDFNRFYLLKNYFKRNKQVVNSDFNIVVCFDYWSTGYFHWMCDFLPRLILLASELESLTVLLPQNFKASFVEPSLKAIGVKHILRFSEVNYVYCSKIIVPGYVTPSGDTNPEIMLKLRKELLHFFKPQLNNNLYAKNIYISRAKTKGRLVINENEVTDMLRHYDFKIIYFEECTFEQQIAIAYNAKNLISIHGANLTNMLFMPSGANVLELRRNNDATNNYYFSLASGLNLNYYYQKCDAQNVRSEQTFDLTVDLTTLEKNVKRMLDN